MYIVTTFVQNTVHWQFVNVVVSRDIVIHILKKIMQAAELLKIAK